MLNIRSLACKVESWDLTVCLVINEETFKGLQYDLDLDLTMSNFELVRAIFI